MAIVASDLILYTSLNHPVNDSGTSGGGIDVTRRPEFTQFTTSAVVALVSDGADTRSVDVVYRDATGALVTETLALTGAVEVTTVGTAERLLAVTIATSSGSRTVSVKQGSGGTVRATIPPNEVGVTACFISSASEAGTVDRHEKLFWRNAHGSLTLNSAEITLTADPSARIKMGLAASKNDTSSIANRKATPGGVSFVDDNVAVAVPTGAMASGDRIGMWIQQGLLASDAPFKSTFTTRCTGISA